MSRQLIDRHWSVLLQCEQSTGVNSTNRRDVKIARGADWLDSSSFFPTAVLRKRGIAIAFLFQEATLRGHVEGRTTLGRTI